MVRYVLPSLSFCNILRRYAIRSAQLVCAAAPHSPCILMLLPPLIFHPLCDTSLMCSQVQASTPNTCTVFLY